MIRTPCLREKCCILHFESLMSFKIMTTSSKCLLVYSASFLNWETICPIRTRSNHSFLRWYFWSCAENLKLGGSTARGAVKKNRSCLLAFYYFFFFHFVWFCFVFLLPGNLDVDSWTSGNRWTRSGSNLANEPPTTWNNLDEPLSNI